MDEDKLFNLFSMYGNIMRIKLLRNKPDHALIQMSDNFQAELGMNCLRVPLIYLVFTCQIEFIYFFGWEIGKREGAYSVLLHCLYSTEYYLFFLI